MARGRTYKAGKRVPGAKNAGILATVSGRFEAFVSYQGRRVSAGTHATVDAARAARDARLLELRGGGTVTSLREKHTLFRAFYEETFLPESYNPPTNPKRASTLRSTASRYATYIEPFFGDRALADITSRTVATFIERLVAGAFRAPETVERTVHGKARTFRPRRAVVPSSKTQREILLHLRAVLAYARRQKYIDTDPFPPKVIPSAKRRATGDMTEAISPRTIMKIVHAIPNLKHRCIAATLAFAGLRIGEALALRWGDLDLKRGYITVERSADAKTREVGPTKTARGNRKVPLDPALTKLLLQYRKTLRPTPRPTDWMFRSERARRTDRSKPPIIDQRVFTQRYWDVARAKVTTQHITPHGARHAWCSIMVTLFPVADVARWAGHHSPSFTFDRYVQPLERRSTGSPIKQSIYTTKGRER
jgi:integrase